MKIKAKLLALAVGAAIAGPALALGPTETPDYILYGGGGAEQNNLFETVARSLLNNVDTYTERSDGSAGAVLRYVFGTLKVAAGSVPAGAKVLIAYRSQGGVFANGVGPVARGQNLPYYSITGATLVGTRYYINTATATVTPNAPDFGLANTEVQLYSGPNLPAGSTALTPAEIANINREPLYQVVNGIAVTSNLYAVKKNFSTAEIGSILAGSLTDWSQLNDDAGNPLAEGPIILADRNAGSGAKAVANQRFLFNPGSSGLGGAVAPANSFGDTGDPVNYSTYTVKTLQSAGLVPTELNAIQAKGQRGIGILGREYLPGSLTYRFIAIDGANAGSDTFDKVPVVNGAYDYFSTASFQSRNKVVNGKRYQQAGTSWGALTAALLAKLKDPAITTTVPGTLLDPTVVSPGDFGGAYDAFITRGTRFGNTTAPLQLQF
ncbi:MAG: hypothetical protein KIT73_00255 [Burkholderiales bacterium]|nr:hypothetical protein [Burkholderiales bacterium]